MHVVASDERNKRTSYFSTFSNPVEGGNAVEEENESERFFCCALTVYSTASNSIKAFHLFIFYALKMFYWSFLLSVLLGWQIVYRTVH